VYGIVRQSGGAVTLDTEPGRGTNVRILLPEHPLAATIEHTVAPAAPRGSERILLVEDEAPVRRLTAQLLEAQGYDVVDAADPYDAIELASSTPIDLLATDVVMPGMDGGELAARLRAERPTLPVLFISGYAPDAVLGSVQPETRTSFLGKPFSAADLAQAVRATLDDGR
jgi:CheY-like chemotaxis protein